MDGVKILPREYVEKLIRKALERQKEIDIKDIVGTTDISGRTSLIVIKGVGTFAFMIKGHEIVYLGAVVKNPTTKMILDRNTFEAIMCNELTVKDAWHKRLIEYRSTEPNWAYHAIIQLKLFEKMREVLGV